MSRQIFHCINEITSYMKNSAKWAKLFPMTSIMTSISPAPRREVIAYNGKDIAVMYDFWRMPGVDDATHICRVYIIKITPRASCWHACIVNYSFVGALSIFR